MSHNYIGDMLLLNSTSLTSAYPVKFLFSIICNTRDTKMGRVLYSPIIFSQGTPKEVTDYAIILSEGR